jgi:hypothetical protein
VLASLYRGRNSKCEHFVVSFSCSVPFSSHVVAVLKGRQISRI